MRIGPESVPPPRIMIGAAVSAAIPGTYKKPCQLEGPLPETSEAEPSISDPAAPRAPRQVPL
jgi:hypothetical protein